MSYNHTFCVYLDVHMCKKVGNGQYNNSMKVVSLNIRKFKH